MTPDYYQMVKDSNQDGEAMLYFILYFYVGERKKKQNSDVLQKVLCKSIIVDVFYIIYVKIWLLNLR